jgi:hypothetical protein
MDAMVSVTPVVAPLVSTDTIVSVPPVVAPLVSIDTTVSVVPVVAPLVSMDAMVSVTPVVAPLVSMDAMVPVTPVVAPLVSIDAIVVVPLVSIDTAVASLVPSVVTGRACASFCATNIAKSAVRTISRIVLLNRRNIIVISEEEIYENTLKSKTVFDRKFLKSLLILVRRVEAHYFYLWNDQNKAFNCQTDSEA